jgi:hypothetical protein
MTDYSYKTCPICGINYAVDQTVMTYKQGLPKGHENGSWHCPNGHSLVFRESDLDKWRREAEQARQENARLNDLAVAEGRRADRAEREAKKVKKRAHAALCPCCNRSFSQLARHMKAKHPEVVQLPVKKAANR